MNEEIKRALVETGLVSQEQVSKAVQKEPGSDCLKALVSIADIDPASLYDGLSKSLRLPYISLHNRKMAPGSNLAVSEECMHYWNFLPIDYDAKDGLMTIAVAATQDAEKIERVFGFLMETWDRGYVIADDAELSALLDQMVAADSAKKSSAPLGAVKEKVPIPIAKKESGKTKVPIPVRKKKAPTGKEAPSSHAPAARPEDGESVSDELVKSLTSAVSLLVNAHFSSDLDALELVKARVRYCQLTATRLSLSALQTTKVILAAWLSAFEHKKEVIRQFVCPYDLEEIIFAEESGRGLGIESLILTMVHAYQELQRESPESAKDVNLTRRGLFMKWSGASKHQEVLETFLQVLMDEQFINKLGQAAGHILVFGGLTADVDVAMERSGYSLKVVNSLGECEADLQGNGADLLLLEVTGQSKDSAGFLRSLKASSVASALPVMAVIEKGADLKGTDLLRAGAEDFVEAPVDIELLMLKAEKLMAVSSAKPQEHGGSSGVSGSLADMSFSDLVQVLSAGGKSMGVSVTNDTDEGRIILRDGNVIHAEAGGVTGEQAFYALMQWQVGQFSMSECHDFPEPTVTASTMSLLMEGARIADERDAG